MKKTVFSIGMIAVTMFTALHATTYAEEPTQIQEKREMRQVFDESRRHAVEQALQERVVNLAGNVEKRLTAASSRMGNIIGRLETRIEKLKTLGVDTSGAEAKFTEAKNSYAAVQDTLEDLSSSIQTVTSNSPRESFNAVRVQFVSARDLIKQTHTLLQETVSLLKDAIRTTPTENGVREAVRENAE